MSPRIAIDVSPLLDLSTGIGYYTANLVSQLIGLRRDFNWSYFAVPRRSEKEISFKIGAQEFRTIIKPWILPARLTSLLLQAPFQPFLAVENFIGPSDLFHWTNFLCLSQRRGKKILTVHDVSFFLFPEHHPLKRRLLFDSLFPRSLEQAHHIITDSQNTKNDLVQHFHVPPKKITTIYLGADPTFAPVSQQEATATLDRHGLRWKQYLLYVGTLEPRKNLVRLMRAYDLFRANYFRPLPLVLVGANGWLNQDLFMEIEKSSWKDDIKILGYVPKTDLSALYSGSLAFVYPSLYEGFGLPPLEAMACGAPVITSNNSSLPEVVGDAAILVDAYNADKIAEAMLLVATDPSICGRLRQRGLERAKCFDWRLTAERTLAVYEKALG